MDPDAEDVVPAHLRVARWREEDWIDDLLERGSLPDISARYAPGRGWDDVLFWLKMAGVRQEFSVDGERSSTPTSAGEVIAARGRAACVLKVWVGPVQFNAYVFDPAEVDFDVPIDVLGDPERFDCLVAFMSFVANVGGGEAVLTHEGARPELVIRSTPVSDVDTETYDGERWTDVLRLADLRRPRFATYRGVIALDLRLNPANVDRWLQNHDVVATTYAVSHVHLYDELHAVADDDVFTALGLEVAERWRAALVEQLPDSGASIGFAGNPEEYGPTVWIEAVGPVDGGNVALR